MRNQLKQVKNGDTQLFMSLMEQHINMIYTIVLKDYGENETNDITQRITLKIYRDIANKFLWQNPHRFIEASIRQSLSRYNLKWINDKEANYNIKQVPTQVVRNIILSLSSKTKRKKRVKSTVTIVSVVSIILLISMVAIFYSKKSSKPLDGDTVFRIYNQSSIVYQENLESVYAWSTKKPSVESITRVNETGMAVTLLDGEGNTLLKLFEKGKLINTLSLDSNSEFICGDISKDYLIFANDKSIIKSNFNGEQIDLINISGEVEAISPNKRYFVIHKDDRYDVFDCELFTIRESGRGVIIGVDNEGNTILYEPSIYSSLTEGARIIDSNVLGNGDVVVLFNDGTIIKHNKNEIIWETMLDGSSITNEKIDLEMWNINGNLTRILSSNDLTHIIFVFDEKNYMQTYDNNGKPLHKLKDTMHKGLYFKVTPVISSDGNAIVRFSTDMYSNGTSYLGFIDTGKDPMEETLIKGIYILDEINIECYDKDYFVYTDTTREFSIYHIKISE